MSITEKLINTAQSLWRGDTINLGSIIPDLNNSISEAISTITSYQNQGYEFPMEYVENAINNLNIAMANDDSFLLADNLYFEWAEIFNVYEEWLDMVRE